MRRGGYGAPMATAPAWDDLLDRLRVDPSDGGLRLARRPTADDFGITKDQALDALAASKDRIDVLQQRLYAQGTHSVLLVVQAMDAAGKDGTIRAVCGGLNPAGVEVTSFKAPAGPEARHDYLWRVHQACPAAGMIGVFNRSHYEDVLVVRVKRFVPDRVWRRRFDHIRHFEQQLVDEGTTVVKVFLHVSRDEQARRFRERLDDPEKRWKFRAGDLEDRALWPQFQRAYQEAIERTSTPDAPWYVVPADSNSSRNLAVSKILEHTLERVRPRVPPPEAGLEHVTIV
jgi:PPK2 family polyphosphate:nucleotide phosphotransferase